jgi:hypothetical protein
LPVHFVDKVDAQKFVSPNEPRACFITSNELNLIPVPKESTQMKIWGWSYNRELSSRLAIDVQSAEAVLTYKRYADRDVP